MFYPFRTLVDIQMDDSYWKLFYRELQLFKKNESTTLRKKGFKILLNIKNQQLFQSDSPKRLDTVTKHTFNTFDTGSKSQKKSQTKDEAIISDIQEQD